MENILLHGEMPDHTGEQQFIGKRQSIFSLITWMNGFICLIMGILGMLFNLEWYLNLLLFTGSLTAFGFFLAEKANASFRYLKELFLFLFYILMVPGCYVFIGLEMCELPIYFIVGIIFTAVILEGWTGKLFLAAEIAVDCAAIWYVTCFTADGIYDRQSIPSFLYIRLLIAVVLAGYAGGILLKYRHNMLVERMKRSKERSERVKTLDSEQDRFMANVSREISIPLHLGREAAQALLDMDMDSQRKEDVFFIDCSGRNLLSAADALLKFAERGREDPNRKENSEKIYRDIVNSIGHATDQKERTGCRLPGKFICPEARILVVDDNIINVEILKSMLEPYRCRTISATGGKECLELLSDEEPDLIFLDYMMPDMDGAETLGRIREMQRERKKAAVPAIALTANEVAGAREMFLNYGFQAYMTKPVEIGRLRQVLWQYLPAEKVTEVS